jgi:hypothetical protein
LPSDILLPSTTLISSPAAITAGCHFLASWCLYLNWLRILSLLLLGLPSLLQLVIGFSAISISTLFLLFQAHGMLPHFLCRQLWYLF